MRLVILFVLACAACGPSASGGAADGGDNNNTPDADPSAPDAPVNNRADAMPMADAGNVYGADADFSDALGLCGTDDSWMCTDPVDDMCDLNGGDDCDGADNDCDGNVDEGCTCASGSVQSCFQGPPGRRGVGACQDGMQTCQGSGEFTYWGPCEGGIRPTPEVCDSLDNDCNGCTDDHPDCCDVELACPAPGSMPDGQPFADYVIDGTAFYPGTVTAWNWTVVGGPCDQLLDATSGTVSYGMSGQTTDTLTLTPTLSGDYTVTVTMTTDQGDLQCTFIVHIEGPGLRVELCWDTTGQADIDLHLHDDPGSDPTPWFTTNLNNNTVNPDDCYYADCKADAFATCPLPPIFCPVQADWGLPSSPLSECSGGPEGAQWTANGSCHNPRLDIDNIMEAGRPENINVDVPANNGTYRAMVHYWQTIPNGGNVPTHPLVNIYCGGTLKATYGQMPDLVSGFNTGGGFGGGTMWRVADVTPQVAGGVTTDCTVTQLHEPGMTTGYYVTTDDRSY